MVRVERQTRHSLTLYTFAYPEYQYLRDRNSVFASVVAASPAIPVLASIGVAAPITVLGAIAATCEANVMYVPADAACPPDGQT